MKTRMLVAGLILTTSSNAEDLSQVNIQAGYQTSQEIFDYAMKTRQVKNSLTAMNYQLDNCKENMIYYYVEPTSELYKKSSYQCIFKGPTNHMSYVHDYAELTIDIYYNKMSMLHNEGNVAVRYWTVY
ncbi:hypothetical protein AADZ91_14525 [Colwelliaceae bacterium 6441]